MLSDDFIGDLKKAYNNLRAEQATLREQLSRVDELLKLVTKAIEVASISDEQRDLTEALFDRLLVKRLKNMTLEDALVFCARNNDGVLNSYQTRPLLVEAGLLKGSPGSISSRLHEALVNSDNFEPLGDKKGRWRLTTYDIDAS